MASALDTLQFNASISNNWTAGIYSGGLGNQSQNINAVSKNYQILSSNATTSATGGNQMLYNFYGNTATGGSAAIGTAGTATSTATIDLQSFTDIMGRTTQSMARIRVFQFRLLGPTETAPDGVTLGTSCSGISIGNAGANGCRLGQSSTTAFMTVDSGSIWEYTCGNTTGIAVTTTSKDIKIQNNDSTYTAVVLATVVGQYT